MLSSEWSTDRVDVAGPTGSRWLVAGYAGLLAFVGLEAVTRKRGPASDLGPSLEDRGTTRMILIAYLFAAPLAPLLRRLPAPRLPHVFGPVGFALEVVGLGVRAWSVHTLGGFYSRTLRTEDGQDVIERGPYRFVRHPGTRARS